MDIYWELQKYNAMKEAEEEAKRQAQGQKTAPERPAPAPAPESAPQSVSASPPEKLSGSVPVTDRDPFEAAAELAKKYPGLFEALSKKKPETQPAPRPEKDVPEKAAGQTGGSASGTGSGAAAAAARRSAPPAPAVQVSVPDAAADLQQRQMQMLYSALRVKNVQDLLTVVTDRTNMRRGLGRDPQQGREGTRGQTSTISIPGSLYQCVLREVGQLSSRMTQSDILTGFLYWYFGQPEDVLDGLPEQTIRRVGEIQERLNVNASPARTSQRNWNMSETLTEKLDAVLDRLDNIVSCLDAAAAREVRMQVRLDDIYIATCYSLLNALAFTPPVAPGQRPSDIDIMAGGQVWDMMKVVDEGYDLFHQANGREVYRTRYRSRISAWQNRFRDMPDDDGGGRDAADPDNSRGSSLYEGDGGDGYDDLPDYEDPGDGMDFDPDDFDYGPYDTGDDPEAVPEAELDPDHTIGDDMRKRKRDNAERKLLNGIAARLEKQGQISSEDSS